MAGKGGHMFIHISKPKNGLLDMIIVSEENESGGGEAMNYKVHTTPIGSNHFMNINIVGKDEQKGLGSEAQYFITHYKVREDGGLEFHFMENKEVTKDVNASKIKGVIKKESFASLAILTASSRELFDYVQQADVPVLFSNEVFEEVLKEHGPFVKLSLPASQIKPTAPKTIPPPSREPINP